jgi:hypothetical protein
MDTVHLSVMSGKLKGMPAINTNTLDNPFCQVMALSGIPSLICAGAGDKPQCYSWSMLSGSRQNCIPKFQQNSDVLSEVIPWDCLPVFNSPNVRYHGHGELINLEHMVNFHRIALKNPQTMFALWSKRRDIILSYHKLCNQPDNLILVYSNPSTKYLLHKPPAGFDKVFNVVSQPHKGENCTGKRCTECLSCYRHSGESVLIEHVKVRN